MKLIGFLIFLLLAFLAVRGSRWAYLGFALMIPLSFFAFAGFRLDPMSCELTFDARHAMLSVTNYGHILVFAFFFLVTTKHFRFSGWPSLGWAVGLTMAMGAAMELAQGLSGIHHCKAVDLIPDFVGVLAGLMLVILGGAIADASRRKAGC